MTEAGVTVSVVSHGHASLVSALFIDLASIPLIHEVVLTINTPDKSVEIPEAVAGRVNIITNDVPRGFGANHNTAFARCRTKYFCVLNPDIRMKIDPFPALIEGLNGAQLAAPLILNPFGAIEDSARRFPTPWRMLRRILGIDNGAYPLGDNVHKIDPDWVGGMFMLFNAETYRALGGFDERFFMYLEDVDICARIRRGGGRIALCTDVAAIHDARRASRRNARHSYWHLKSLLSFFRLHWGHLPRRIYR